MSLRNSHRKPKKATLLIIGLGVGLTVLAKKKPEWAAKAGAVTKQAVAKVTSLRPQGDQEETHPMDVAAEVAAEFCGPLDKHGREILSAALYVLAERLTGRDFDAESVENAKLLDEQADSHPAVDAVGRLA